MVLEMYRLPNKVIKTKIVASLHEDSEFILMAVTKQDSSAQVGMTICKLFTFIIIDYSLSYSLTWGLIAGQLQQTVTNFASYSRS